MLTVVREQLGEALFRHVAGPDGPATRTRIHDTPGPRWFGPDRPIRTVHGDASMFIGGLSALLLQSLHPLAMAAVAGHSGYRGDPWGRLQRTSTFLAVTTYGTAADAQRAVDHVRGIHERIRGTTVEGVPYHAADPHLLGWVHAAETDSFLRAHERFGARPLDAAGYDAYVADTARVAAALGGERPTMRPPRALRAPDGLPARTEGLVRGPGRRPLPAVPASPAPCGTALLRRAGRERRRAAPALGPRHAEVAPDTGRRESRRTPHRTGPDPDHPVGHDPTSPAPSDLSPTSWSTSPPALAPRRFRRPARWRRRPVALGIRRGVDG